MNVVDISNYTGPLDPAQVAALRDNFGLVIVQAVDPPSPPYPVGVTREQVLALQAAGVEVEAYIYLWFDEPVASVRTRLNLLNGLGIKRVWLDVEDAEGSMWYTTAQCQDKVRAAVYAIAEYGYEVGIYTAKWFWGDWMGPEFSYLPLWVAQYDDIPDLAVFNPFGGWSQAAIKQYVGTTQLDYSGVLIPNVDLNVAADPPPVATPHDYVLALVHAAVRAKEGGDARDLSAEDKAALKAYSDAANTSY